MNQDTLPTEQGKELLELLKLRFVRNMNRHEGLDWEDIQKNLELNPHKLFSLSQMEQTGGEPDVIGIDEATGEFIYCDCSAETPKGRRSICYDLEAQKSRKEHAPENNAVDMAAMMGIELMSEEQYFHLQSLGRFDTKTSSWIKTPHEIRALGGALFVDSRYERVFIYHNGAQSYYSVRGFRGILKV